LDFTPAVGAFLSRPTAATRFFIIDWIEFWRRPDPIRPVVKTVDASKTSDSVTAYASFKIVRDQDGCIPGQTVSGFRMEIAFQLR
jgi:hypothetical protein